jgi:hypothetical protein
VNCCVFPLLSLNPVDCYIPRSIHGPSIVHRIDLNRSGANCFIGPSSRAHLVLRSSSNPPSPHLRAAAEAVSSAHPNAKLTASIARATEARGGFGDGVGWLLWLVAIVR